MKTFPTNRCLSTAQLQALKLGLDSDDRLEQLAAHVESCGRCLAELERVESADPLSAAVRAAPSTHDAYATEPAFSRLYEDLRKLAPKYASTVLLGSESSSENEFSPAAPTPATLPEGSRARPFTEFPVSFGRYLVRRQLGRGGMGEVYLAWDTQLEREVALKVPSARRDPRDAHRFLREARAAAALDHPHVCPIYDYGQLDGVPYLSLKYIEGRTLADVLDAGPLPIRTAVELARQTAEALAAAHRAGVTHRDLKPGNIMLDGAGQPWVMDFGLARREAADPALIREGEIFGTPVYMSPEQAEGQGDRVGAASDIYTLGVVLYEMLAGRPPFSGNVAKVLEKIRNDEPSPPSQHRPEIDPRLDAICRKALAKQAADRYATAADFAAALRLYQRTLPEPMPGLEQDADDQTDLRRKRLMRWALAAAALLLFGLLGFFSLGGGRVIAEVAQSWFAREWEASAPQEIAQADRAADEIDAEHVHRVATNSAAREGRKELPAEGAVRLWNLAPPTAGVEPGDAVDFSRDGNAFFQPAPAPAAPANEPELTLAPLQTSETPMPEAAPVEGGLEALPSRSVVLQQQAVSPAASPAHVPPPPAPVQPFEAPAPVADNVASALDPFGGSRFGSQQPSPESEAVAPSAADPAIPLPPSLTLTQEPLAHAREVVPGAAARGPILGVVRKGRAAVRGVTVTLEGSDKPSVKTDSQGRFRFNDVPVGVYTLKADGVFQNRAVRGEAKVEHNPLAKPDRNRESQFVIQVD